MKELIFSEGFPEASDKLDFDQSIFNKRDHRCLQSADGWLGYYARETKTKKILATIYFHKDADTASSPLRAPFGSLEFSSSLPLNGLSDFIDFFEQSLKRKGIGKIIIKNRPTGYDYRNESLLTGFLIDRNYQIVKSEISSIIPIDKKEFTSELHRSKKRKLSKAKTDRLRFDKLPAKKLEDVYNFILRCRTEKAYKLSMTFDELKGTVEKFPERFFLFGVYKGDRLIAASIAIRVTKHVLYEFYHDHDKEFDNLSPVVTLVAGIYDFCYSHNIEFLDLGTSSTESGLNLGLLNFKLLLSGVPSPKFTFSKTL